MAVGGIWRNNAGMSRVLIALLCLGALAGCHKDPAPTEPAPSLDSSQPAPGTTSQSGGSDGVQIHSPGAGGLAPVTGTESLGGSGGGGVGQAAKDQARRAAASPSSTAAAGDMTDN